MIDHDNLEEYSDPIHYDLEFGGETKKYQFYLDSAKEMPGTVLELACGTGLVTLPLAEAGIAIVGVDIAEPMLAYARVKGQGLPAHFIQADARTFQSDQRFSLIYLTGNAFQAFLSDEDQLALLRTVHQHLQPGGRFIFETRNPAATDLSDEEESPWSTFTDQDGQLVQVSGSQTYDASRSIMHWVTYRTWPHKRTISRIACRFTDHDALIELLTSNGFEIQHQYADWDRTPFVPSSDLMIMVCAKAES
ncbi:class I SAM-dependent methyltransferase [Paenibacillus wenxiniae]|uniref:Class I SAM-dependent methyltransferase n=1 Tax=Paenibacillus wenxiniae TaxID=1636843 RepID=A0ABW4RP59_9BACL